METKSVKNKIKKFIDKWILAPLSKKLLNPLENYENKTPGYKK